MKSNLTEQKLLSICVALLLAFAAFGVNAQSTRELTQEEKEDNRKASPKRVALVIGNGAYTKAKALPNPSNDAADMAKTLRDLGFEVISGVNQNKRQMETMIREFGTKLAASGGVGLFYYAGHGLQVAGENYLVPVDADIPEQDEIAYAAVPVNLVLSKMTTAKNDLNIIILDACRNNPFARSWRTFRDNSNTDGLAKLSPPTGTLVLYATEPGKVASDGTGRNGLFTEALLKQIKRPDLEYDQMVKAVSADVWQRSNRQQLPWKEGNTLQDFYFAPKTEQPGAALNNAPTAAKTSQPVPVKTAPNDAGTVEKPLPEKGRIESEQTKSNFSMPPENSKVTPANTAAVDRTAGLKPGAVNSLTLPGGAVMSFALIPAGSFEMGSTADIYEGPVHTVKITRGFWMQSTEVTQAQWQALMGTNPSYFQDCPKCPVERVSWNDAQLFIAKLNALNDGFTYRLPTEAEWEYAARAGTTGDYAGNPDLVAWYYKNSGNKTLSGEFDIEKLKSNKNRPREVGKKQPNAWGLYDMIGNVSEWCQDWHVDAAYTSGTRIDPAGPATGKYRLRRGGDWANQPQLLRVSYRWADAPTETRFSIGFRVVRQ